VTVSCGQLLGDKRQFQQFYKILLNNLQTFRGGPQQAGQETPSRRKSKAKLSLIWGEPWSGSDWELVLVVVISLTHHPGRLLQLKFPSVEIRGFFTSG